MTFLQYVLSDDIFHDLQRSCLYVNAHRDALYVDPIWNLYTDCIYYQLAAANQTLTLLPIDTLEEFLFPFWGQYAYRAEYVTYYWN